MINTSLMMKHHGTKIVTPQKIIGLIWCLNII